METVNSKQSALKKKTCWINIKKTCTSVAHNKVRFVQHDLFILKLHHLYLLNKHDLYMLKIRNLCLLNKHDLYMLKIHHLFVK